MEEKCHLRHATSSSWALLIFKIIGDNSIKNERFDDFIVA